MLFTLEIDVYISLSIIKKQWANVFPQRKKDKKTNHYQLQSV